MGIGLEFDNIDYVRKIDSKHFNNNKVIKSVCGYYHSIILTQNGNVYSFGDNTCAALGIPGCDRKKEPTIVNYFSDNNIFINDIECGQDHAICLTNDDNIYVFGDNNYGQCGVINGNSLSRNDKLIHLPVILGIKDKIKNINVGLNCSILKNTDNDFIVFGDNNGGQLFESKRTQYIKTPTYKRKKWILTSLGLEWKHYNLDVYIPNSCLMLIVSEK